MGPAIVEIPHPPSRIFRALDINLIIQDGRVTTVTLPAGVVAGTVNHNPAQISISLQPVWMQSPNNNTRSNNPISLIVVHHTGGNAIGPALNTFLHAGGTSAHYVVDTDGQVVKMIRDSDTSLHAGISTWRNNPAASCQAVNVTRGLPSINNLSIGIEIVNQSGPYSPAQYDALINLLQQLLNAYPTIDRSQIVGHNDVATGVSGLNHAFSMMMIYDDDVDWGGRAPILDFEWMEIGDQ